MHAGRYLSCLFLLAALTVGWAAEDRPLADYLRDVNERGLRIIFSSDLVTPAMSVDADLEPVETQAALGEVLRPFGLKASAGPGGTILIMRGDETPEGPPSSVAVREPSIPEIVVTSSLHRLEYSPSGTHSYLDRELTTRIPAAAEEAVRLTNRLPGTASGGISSQNHVRGGEVNEVLFVFDGLRLYEPYHLKDFQTVATIVNSNAVGSIDFYTGAYPARYGDRMSGVMDISLREPEKPLETEIALSFFNTSVLSLGNFGGGDRGNWLVTGRRGNLDLIADAVDPEIGSPAYQDYLAHVGWDFGPRARISFSYLASQDKLRLFDIARGETARAVYKNQVTWVRWLADWSDVLSSDSLVAYSDISDRRTGILDLPGIVSGELFDRNSFQAFEFRQDWAWTPADSWMLQFGFDGKHLDASYDVSAVKQVSPPFDNILDNEPLTVIDARIAPGGSQYAAFTELRWRPSDRLTVDLGLRWDQQTYTTASDDRQYSPRAGVLFEPGDRTEIRLGWGQYYQAQEINELQLTDGVTEFFPAQRAEHVVLNARRWFTDELDLAVSVYRKNFRTIRPRFENAFNTLTLLPELQFDRVGIDADNAEALGAEIILTRGSHDDDLLWWISYTWSRVEDRVAGTTVRRSWNQTHTAKGGISWKWRAWDFSLAGEIHTGWPKTVLLSEMVAQPGGSTRLEVSTSVQNQNKYADFSTLDLRISRIFSIPRGELTTFLEVTNLYDRQNPCCTEYALATDGSVDAREAHWLPFVPSLGIVWRF